jgi:hypothetical protein
VAQPRCTETFAAPSTTGTATAPGVITAWTVRHSNTSGSPTSISLRVLRFVSGSTYLGIRSGNPSVFPTGSATVTFGARVPISAGDQIGTDEDGSAIHDCGPPGSQSARWNPPLADGEQRATGGNGLTGGGCEPQIQASVEPDADGDGFGDETQDGCPTNPLVQSTCPAAQPATPKPPDTTAPNATFRLDGKKPSLGTALKKGIKLRVSSNEAVSVEADAYTKVTSFKAAVPVGGVVLARKKGSLRAAGTLKLTLKLSKAGRRSLKHRRTAKLQLEVSARDLAGNTTTRSSKLTLKR